ncbi:maleylacetoacetate isomerase [Pollutimonas nitritireducens]|uniref:Maleylacetoacetate isomerase n=1 Tax=Pollutimonas nitritireducens TaxID=2045209 RepID=A0A2N4UFI9_9BURK|nr:maleylacetoacetate isomerase [Pollutimonas nitritireducens]PLC53770.1 maleylacetoacetate isomerase [Pollutimonas nitritireducens]
MKLYGYFRSSAAYRVRIALNLKNLPYETVPVHLLKDGGQQLTQSYRELNPTGLVPTLQEDDWTLGQSMAILEYLEETHPNPPLLPVDARQRARVRSIAQFIACDIHPLNNLRVLKYLKHELKVDEDARNAWYRHWVEQGLAAVEGMLAGHSATGRYCHGDQPTFADLCLIPQMANARRFNCDLSTMPTIASIDAACAQLPAFQQAAPGSQPDSEA